jgi:hypothetical protein
MATENGTAAAPAADTAAAPAAPAGKKVTFVYYSYTGQNKLIVDTMADVFRARGYEIGEAAIGFPDKRWTERFSKFPLPMMRLIGMLIPQMRGATGEIVIPDEARKTDADLVVIAGPTWFFRTSIPVRTFLKSAEAKALLADRQFATVVVCRRYWSINEGNVRRHATKLGGKHLDSIHFRFEGGQVRSLLSLLSYLTKGEMKERYLGIKIPVSNLQPDQLPQATAFATKLADGLEGAKAAGPAKAG